MPSIFQFPKRMSRAARQFAWRRRLGGLGGNSDIRPGASFETPRGIVLGSDCCIGHHAILRANSSERPGVTVGDRVHIGEFTIVAANRGRVTIGDDSWIGPHSTVHGNGGVIIGSHVMIAAHCAISSVSHLYDRLDMPMSEQGVRCEPVWIEDDVWIGTGAIVLQGVRIGRGSIVAAGAVVNQDLAPGSIAMGVPARTRRNRFTSGARPELIQFPKGVKN